MDLNFTTPRGYSRGEILQYRAQWRRNRSNPSPCESLIGAAFISSTERYFSTATLLVPQVELLLQSRRILVIQRPDRVLLEAVQRLGSRHPDGDSLDRHDHRFDRLE